MSGLRVDINLDNDEIDRGRQFEIMNDAIEEGSEEGHMYDVNGNHIGKWEIYDD